MPELPTPPHTSPIRRPLLIRRLLSVAVTLALALLLMGITGVTGNAAPITRAATGTCTVTPGKAPFPTISSATSGASGANCATVMLPFGTIKEQVVIDHPLTLVGKGAGKTTILHPAPGPTTKSIVENGDAEDYVIDVTSPGVTISKLTIDGASYGCHTHNTCGSSNANPDYILFGIALQARYFTLDSATLQHLGNTKQSGDGVPIGGQSIVSGSNDAVTLKNSAFRSFTGPTLMLLNPEPAPFVFTHNTVSGSTANVIGLAYGGDGAQITSNTFSGFMARSGAVNVALAITGANDEISGNSFSHDGTGIFVAGASGANTLEHNTFTQTQGAILLGMDTAGQIVRNNKISFTTAGKGALSLGAGILLCQEGADQISGNTITRAVYGIVVLQGSSAGCAAPTAASMISANTFSRSSRYDLLDETRGGGTGGTMNTYSGNTCRTSSPLKLCGAHLVTRQVGVAGSATPFPAAIPSIGAYLAWLQHSALHNASSG